MSEVVPRIVTGYIAPIEFDKLINVLQSPEFEKVSLEPEPYCDENCACHNDPNHNYWKAYSFPQDRWAERTQKLTEEQLQEAAYYVWLETGADSEWCWYEAIRRNS